MDWKPRKSSFRRTFRIAIPMFLEGVMPISVTVREAEKFQVVATKVAIDSQLGGDLPSNSPEKFATYLGRHV